MTNKEAERLKQDMESHDRQQKQWEQDMKTILERSDFNFIDKCETTDIKSLMTMPVVLNLIGICRNLVKRVEELEQKQQDK